MLKRHTLVVMLLLSAASLPVQSQTVEGRKFGVGVAGKVSTLGIGFDVAVPIAPRLNIRGGFNGFNYDHNLTKDGVQYNGTLQLKSVNALVDIFPFGNGFHLSGGALLYNDNRIKANANVPGGQTFTLGSVNYVSSAANPVTGTGNVDMAKAAPMVLFGWGNLVPRISHFSFSIETGVVFQGSPKTTLGFAGNACDPTGINCRNIATDPTIQSNIQAQQTKLNDDLKPFQYYPVVSIGIGYKF